MSEHVSAEEEQRLMDLGEAAAIRHINKGYPRTYESNNPFAENTQQHFFWGLGWQYLMDRLRLMGFNHGYEAKVVDSESDIIPDFLALSPDAVCYPADDLLAFARDGVNAAVWCKTDAIRSAPKPPYPLGEHSALQWVANYNATIHCYNELDVGPGSPMKILNGPGGGVRLINAETGVVTDSAGIILDIMTTPIHPN